ncbi:MAG: hypothetical protein M3Y59_13420 [Myxococcota bacterium]|nr:hypothetical protein [Myxococcota bacterium]
MLELHISDQAAFHLSRLPRGLNERLRKRLDAITNRAVGTPWQAAFVGMRGARTLESVLDGFAMRYSVDAAAQSLTLLLVEDRRDSGSRVGA